VALLNVTNTVKAALEQRLLALTDPALQPALGRLIDTIGRLSPASLMGSAIDGRPLANFSNFLRKLGELQTLMPGQSAQLTGLAGACASLVQTINDETFDYIEPDSQVLANLVSFIKFCDKHASTQSSSVTVTTASTTATSTTTASTSRTDRITPLLSTPLLQQAAGQVMMFLLEATTDELREPETIGGLLSGLDYLWRRKLVVPSTQIKELAETLLQQVGQHKGSTWNDQRKVTLLPALLGMLNSGMVNERALQPALAVLLSGARTGTVISVNELRRESIRVGGIEEIIIALPPLPITSALTTSSASTSSTATTSTATTSTRPIPGDTAIKKPVAVLPLASTTPMPSSLSSMQKTPVREKSNDGESWEVSTKESDEKDIAITTAPKVINRGRTNKKGSPPKPGTTTANNAGNNTRQRTKTKSDNAAPSVAKTDGHSTSNKKTQSTKTAKSAKPALTPEAAIISGQSGQLDALLRQSDVWTADEVTTLIDVVMIEINRPNQNQITALNRFLDLVLPKLKKDQSKKLVDHFKASPPPEQALRNLLIKRGMLSSKDIKPILKIQPKPDMVEKTVNIEQSSLLNTQLRSQDLVLACINGDVKRAKQILAQDPEGKLALQKNSNGGNPLMIIMQKKNSEIEQMLLRLPNVEEQAKQLTKQGFNALMIAAQCGRADAAEQLLKLSSGRQQAIQKSLDGANALMIAAQTGSKDVVERLLNHESGSVQATNQSRLGATALMLAASAGHTAVVEHLLNHKSSDQQTTLQDFGGGIALMAATASNQLDVVRQLLKHKTGSEQAIQKNGEGWNAIMMAAQFSHIAIFERLLNHTNASQQALQKNNDGWNAMMIAAESGHIAILEQLLNHTNGSEQATQKNRDGFNALMTAAKFDRIAILEKLLNHTNGSQQALQKNNDGWNAMMIAAESGHIAILDQLLNHASGSQQALQENDLGWIAMMVAAFRGHIAVVDKLLDHSSSSEQVGTQDKKGRNAEAWAKFGNHQDIAEKIAAWRTKRMKEKEKQE
jgi:ankyrin repeat protein